MRYLRPMFVSKSCLTCHGRPEDVPAFLRQVYGDRLKTGYTKGQLRGAISISWPTRVMQVEEHRTEALAACKLLNETMDVLIDGGTVQLGPGQTAAIAACRSPQNRPQLEKTRQEWREFNQSVETLFSGVSPSDSSWPPWAWCSHAIPPCWTTSTRPWISFRRSPTIA